jgi:hypothetical protein
MEGRNGWKGMDGRWKEGTVIKKENDVTTDRRLLCRTAKARDQIMRLTREEDRPA